MLSDIIDSAKSSLVERLSSPFLGSFSIAWSAWNYKFLVILFSDATVSRTFELIDKVAFPSTESIVLHGILYPLISSCIYVFLYPYPARFIYEFTLKRQREVNLIRQSIAEETPLTLEESRRIRTEIVDRERKNQLTISTLNEEISTLRRLIDEHEKKQHLESSSKAPEANLKIATNSQLEILAAIEKYGKNAMENALVNSAAEGKTKAKFDIGELEQNQLISKEFVRTAQDWRLSLTHSGRKTLLDSFTMK